MYNRLFSTDRNFLCRQSCLTTELLIRYIILAWVIKLVDIEHSLQVDKMATSDCFSEVSKIWENVSYLFNLLCFVDPLCVFS